MTNNKHVELSTGCLVWILRAMDEVV